MSQSEVERFISDLKSNDTLRDELSLNASGIGSVVTFAKDKGYDITADEARGYIQAQSGRELNDAELDAVAGGKPGSQAGTQVTEAVTTAATTQAVQAVVGPAVEAVVGTQALAAVVVT